MPGGNDRDKMHPFWQFVMNCIISAIVGGIAAALGMHFFVAFFICLAACYGFWLVFIRDRDGDGIDWGDIFR